MVPLLAFLLSPHARIALLVVPAPMFLLLHPIKFVLQVTFARRSQKVHCRPRTCVPLDTIAPSNLDPRSHARRVSIRKSQGNLLVLHARPETTAQGMPPWFRSCACQGFTALSVPRARMRILALRAGIVHPPVFVCSMIARYARQAFTAAAPDTPISLGYAERVIFA
jgi:hypothetical protein